MKRRSNLPSATSLTHSPGAARSTIRPRRCRIWSPPRADNYQLSDARYRGGIDTFLQSLDAQRSLYTAQRTLVTAELTKATNLVTLYTSLGGDAQLDATANGPAPRTPETPAEATISDGASPQH